MNEDKLSYCYNCDKNTLFYVEPRDVSITIKGVGITYQSQVAYCGECKNEVYIAELDDANIKLANKIYRDKAGIIHVEEIQALLDKYDIGKKPLAKLLGWGETTIERYINGITPLKIYSDELKRLQNPRYMEKIYEANKASLTESAQNKIENKLYELLNYKPKNTVEIYDVADYFLSKVDMEAGSCITPLKLQKLLYYAQGWFLAFYDAPLFSNDFQAWVHGPVSSEIYTKYQHYGYKGIDKSNCDLSKKLDPKQNELLNEIYITYGSYDAKALENMTHVELPWKKARNGIGGNDRCREVIHKENMKKYFDLLRELFNIVEVHDIKKCLIKYQDVIYINP